MQFKRGDAFEFVGTVPVVALGIPVTNYAGWTARSQIRTASGTLIAELDVNFLLNDDPVPILAGDIEVVFVGSTQDWPLGDTIIDIEFTPPGGGTFSTSTSTFKIVPDVTRPPA